MVANLNENRGQSKNPSPLLPTEQHIHRRLYGDSLRFHQPFAADIQCASILPDLFSDRPVGIRLHGLMAVLIGCIE